MGTPEFAVPSLNALVENGKNVVAVVTAPDKPAGRGLKLQTSAVKDAALNHNIPVLQPANLKSSEFLEELKSYQADLQVVIAFRMLPQSVWSMPNYGTFNLHASLLPQYRGAAPINWAIINGEKETGLTTFLLKQEIDTGDVILQEKETIKLDDTAGTLYERLMSKGAGLVLKTVELIENNNYKLLPQVTTNTIIQAPKIHKETCKIDWNKTAAEVQNFIRGLSPYPAAWTMIQDKSCKIYRTHIINTKSNKKAGEYNTDGKTYLHLVTADGEIAIDELQLEGKKRMGIEEFLRGNKL